MARITSILTSHVPLVMSHGFIETPTSRSELVCTEIYGKWDESHTDPDNGPYYCLTARETICWTGTEPPLGCGQGLDPDAEQPTQGVPVGTVPGKAVVAEPFCSAGQPSDHINQEAFDGLNKRGESQATWQPGATVKVGWNVQAAHGGQYAYALCCDGSDTWECFSKNMLEGDDGTVWYPLDWSTMDIKYDNLKVPEDLSGECTLAWRWDGGCTDGGVGNAHCHAGQTSESSVFASCSDVFLGPAPTPDPTPEPTPDPTPEPTPKPSPSPPAPSPSPSPTSNSITSKSWFWGIIAAGVLAVLGGVACVVVQQRRRQAAAAEQPLTA